VVWFGLVWFGLVGGCVDWLVGLLMQKERLLGGVALILVVERMSVVLVADD
jgi:hypothetical protein